MRNGSDFNGVSFLDEEHLKYLFLSPQGRVNRQRFWLGGLLLFLVYIAAFILYGILSAIGSLLGIAGIFLIIVVAVGFSIGGIMLQIKRAHDRNHSGWYILLTMIPFIGILFTIELLFFGGTAGANGYGMDPT